MAEVKAAAVDAGLDAAAGAGVDRGGHATANPPNRSGRRRRPGHDSTPVGPGSPPHIESEDRRPKGGAVLARYPGRCPLCDDPINVGDLILQYETEWVHEHCAELEEQIAEDVERLRDGVHIDQQALDVEPESEE